MNVGFVMNNNANRNAVELRGMAGRLQINGNQSVDRIAMSADSTNLVHGTISVNSMQAAVTLGIDLSQTTAVVSADAIRLGTGLTLRMNATNATGGGINLTAVNAGSIRAHGAGTTRVGGIAVPVRVYGRMLGQSRAATISGPAANDSNILYIAPAIVR